MLGSFWGDQYSGRWEDERIALDTRSWHWAQRREGIPRAGGWGWRGGGQRDPPVPPPGAGFNAAWGLSPINLPPTGWSSPLQPGWRHTYCLSVPRGCENLCVQRCTCVYLCSGLGRSSISGAGGADEMLLSQVRCLFKQSFAAPTPRVLFQWTPRLWSPVNTRLIAKAIVPR